MQAPSDLPIELIMAILRLAARHAALHDRTWLCVLARTSRFVWRLVLPILYETVSVTPNNATQIVATVQSSSRHWLLTKNLYLGDDSESFLPDVLAFASAFSGVQHVICDIELLKQLLNAHAGFRPTRFTCTSMFLPTSWTPEFSGITHLHMATDGWNWTSLGPPPPLSGALTHVVVQICPQHAAGVLPWFFASPTVQRVAVWEARWSVYPQDVPLAVFARAHLDRRIRLIGDEERVPPVLYGEMQHPIQRDATDPSLPPLINPYLPDILTFDPALWEIGKEVQW